MPEFCKTYFYIFNEGLKATFDKRNTDGFFKKISYNNKILRDETFVECLNEADLSSENQNYIKMLKSGNYLRIYLIQKLYALKGGRRKG